ncbi:hypothetical protein R1sor_014258 [Riccia sorocarpa]|uniref:Uncharacterized protein n=1 Tax=Riccia sorocarpa TaxID=122646 RepID=A0ABD3HF06_9MARC
MRSIADSPTMRHMENAYHEMADNPRAVHLGMATNGFSPVSLSEVILYMGSNVYKLQHTSVVVNKKKDVHILLSLIIPGQKKPSNFDVNMGPVVDELKLLWTGSRLRDCIWVASVGDERLPNLWNEPRK